MFRRARWTCTHAAQDHANTVSAKRRKSVRTPTGTTFILFQRLAPTTTTTMTLFQLRIAPRTTLRRRRRRNVAQFASRRPTAATTALDDNDQGNPTLSFSWPFLLKCFMTSPTTSFLFTTFVSRLRQRRTLSFFFIRRAEYSNY